MQYLVYPLELAEGLTYTMNSLVPRPFPPTRKGLETNYTMDMLVMYL